MNIEDIKERVRKNNLLPSCDLLDLSSDVEYLLSIIEQAEQAFESIINIEPALNDIEEDILQRIDSKAKEALQAIRK